MTNKYETGVWYGWNGGKRPVHHKTVVQAIFDDGSGAGEEIEAGLYGWEEPENPVAFRIITPYAEQQRLEADNKRLREVLGFYADETQYETAYETLPCECCTDIFEPIMRDKGQSARTALGDA